MIDALNSYDKDSVEARQETINNIQTRFDKMALVLQLQKALEVINTVNDEKEIDKNNEQIQKIITLMKSVGDQLPEALQNEVKELLMTRKKQEDILQDREAETNKILNQSKDTNLSDEKKTNLRNDLKTIEEKTQTALEKTGITFKTVSVREEACKETSFFGEMQNKITKQGNEFAKSINNFFHTKIRGISDSLKSYVESLPTAFTNLFQQPNTNTDTETARKAFMNSALPDHSKTLSATHNAPQP